MAQKQKTSVLFVCLGNICRSPMAEAHFINHVRKAGLTEQFHIDSAGTNGFHNGERADARMRATAQRHGVEVPSISRQVKLSDFQEFDYILAMDRHNLRDLQRLQSQVPGSQSKLILMRDFDEGFEGQDVPDPYYGGQEGFEEVFRMLERATEGFLRGLR